MCCKANLAVVIDHYSSTSFLPRKNSSFPLFPLLGLHLSLLLLLQNGIDDRNTSILTFNMQYSSAALSTLLIYKTEKIYICQVFYYRPNCEQNAAHYHR